MTATYLETSIQSIINYKKVPPNRLELWCKKQRNKPVYPPPTTPRSRAAIDQKKPRRETPKENQKGGRSKEVFRDANLTKLKNLGVRSQNGLTLGVAR
jgi:hypothetical protein